MEENLSMRSGLYGHTRGCTVCGKIIDPIEDNEFVEIHQETIMYAIDRNTGMVEKIPTSIRGVAETFCESCFNKYVIAFQDFLKNENKEEDINESDTDK
jgi:hypothetical protein